VEADTVIVAIGQAPDLSFLNGSGVEIAGEGTIPADSDTLATSVPKVFVAGDAHTGPATVIQAVANGKKAALGIKAFLTGNETLVPRESERVVGYEGLNVSYFKHEPRQELVGTELEALKDAISAEAQRCFQCGRCNVCNTCWYLIMIIARVVGYVLKSVLVGQWRLRRKANGNRRGKRPRGS
jgi:heterodisulfide reductase subunit A-like polyferredoxin